MVRSPYNPFLISLDNGHHSGVVVSGWSATGVCFHYVNFAMVIVMLTMLAELHLNERNAMGIQSTNY